MASLITFEPRTVSNRYKRTVNAVDYQPLQDDYSAKWTYLLADKITFSDTVKHGIRLQKPNDSLLVHWLERIITAGQCSQLFVEELELSEIDQRRITNLCLKHEVVLINLFTDRASTKNVIKGPWEATQNKFIAQ